jgi:pimeloyl-ACP methyl ester carboxylesterase
MSSPVRRVAAASAGLVVAAGAGLGAQRVVAQRLRRRPDPDAGDDWELPFDEQRLVPSHDDGSINVFSRGSGQPIVMSHGVLLTAQTWVKQFRTFPELGFRAVAFDHRGHGGSTCGTDGHTVDTLASDVRTVLEALDLRDAILVGHSMGGVAVQAFCIRFPEVAAERVAGIVLMSTLARSVIGGHERMASAMTRLAQHSPDGTPLLGTPNLGLVLTRFGFGKDPQPSHIELTRRMLLSCDRETRRDSPASLIGLELTPDLAKIAVPTLVMCGTADRLTPLAESRRIAACIPNARLAVLEGGGHMLMLEQAQRVDELITKFAVQGEV